MKKSLILLAILAIGNFMIVTSCAKKQTGYGAGSPPPGTVTTLAGPSFSNTSGSGASASFNQPYGVAVDGSDNVYVADLANNMIRKISSGGVVSTLAGTGAVGTANGPGSTATFNSPIGVALDKSGNLYVADFGNNMIRMISPAGVVSTLAGTGAVGKVNGAGTVATFYGPTGVAVDGSGNVYVADQDNELIRKINSSGVVSTLAGTGAGGRANGPDTVATFGGPTGVAVDNSGNVYVADLGNNLIRKINSSGVVSTLAGKGNDGYVNGPDSAASFGTPFGIAVDATGNVYVAEIGNQDIRMINPAGMVSTLAGSGRVGSTNGIGTQASFWFPTGVAVDAAGNVYVADKSNNLIREINPSDIVTTLAGNGGAGSANSSDSASFILPSGVAADAQQNVYVADQGNNVIRKIDSKGVVTTLAGNGTKALVNGPALSASFYSPNGIAVDSKGNIYVSELDNVIRMIIPSGAVSTFAGNGQPGSANGQGAAATFYQPAGIALDGSGNVYVADAGNNLIRVITPGGVVTTLAGTGRSGFVNGMGTAAAFSNPLGVAVDFSGNVFVADAGNNLIRKISPSGATSTFAGGGVGGGSVDGLGTNAAFAHPAGIAIDVSANLFVTDYLSNEIRLITSAGSVSTLAGNGTAGSANGVGMTASFNQPVGIAVDQHGYIYVADMGNNLIRMITQAP